ncbi:MAG: hypothetical protein KGI37_05420 [Alphaproteobacteria bacterium]|nr:hypothetical protein [Alphaproteobacteria bacterium]
MADISSTSASAPAAAPTSAAGNLTAVQAAVTASPASLQDLTRSIQTNATVTAATISATGSLNLTLSTALGDIAVSLPQIGEALQQQLLQQLLTLVQTSKTVTVTIQPNASPGSPPSQAVILLPSSPQTANAVSLPASSPAATTTTPQPTAATTVAILPVAAKGDVLTAIVLPTTPASPTISLPSILPAQLPKQWPEEQAAPIPAPAGAPPATTTDISSTSPPYNRLLAQPENGAPVAPAARPLATPDNITEAATATIETPPSLSTTPPAGQISENTAVTPIPSATQNLAALLRPGNEIAMRIESFTPSLAGESPTTLPPYLPAGNGAPNQIMATVTGHTPEGKMILQTGDTTLFVKTPLAAPVGSSLLLTAELAKPDMPVTLPLPAAPQTAGLPALAQAVAALAQIDPTLAQQMIAAYTPQPTAASLPGALLLLFGAFKNGDARALLGNDATDTLLQNGKGDIVAALSRDLSNAGQPAQDQIVGDWRAYPVPLYAQQQFQALTLYVHHDREARRENNGLAASKKTRFIIDMKLSKLGAMQIDGFTQHKRVDLILRSEAVLPSGLHDSLRTAYFNAMDAVGYTGVLSFQVGSQNWVRMRGSARGGIVT